MSEARNNLVHLPLYGEEPALREHANCKWCSWHQVGQVVYDTCIHPVLTGNGTGYCTCDKVNQNGKCKHYDPSRTTRLIRWTRLGRKPIMVLNE
jgi:hypothetical protein